MGRKARVSANVDAETRPSERQWHALRLTREVEAFEEKDRRSKRTTASQAITESSEAQKDSSAILPTRASEA